MNATQASDEESDEPAAKRRILNGRASKSTNGSRHLNSNGNGNGNGPSHSGDEEGNGGEDDDEGDGVEWTKEGFVPRPINKDEATFAALGSMRSRMSDPIRRIDDSLEQYVAVAKAIEDAEEDHAMIDQIQSDFLSCLEIRQALRIQVEVLKELETAIKMGEEMTDIESRFKAESSKRIEEWMSLSQKAKFKESDEFRNFREEIWEIHHRNQACPPVSRWLQKGDDDEESDDEIEMGGTTQDYRCPITRLPYEDAVKSSKCGHSYSKHAILSLFTAKKTSVKCPFAGCGNTVSRSELEPNPTLQRRTDENQRRMARRRSEDDEAEEVEE